jgi:hypothetical protein
VAYVPFDPNKPDYLAQLRKVTGRTPEINHGRYQPVACWVCHRGYWEPVRECEVRYWAYLGALLVVTPRGHA